MTSKQLRHSNSLWQCSDFRKISEQKVFKPFKVSSGSDEQDSSDEDAESDTDRHNEQHTYTYTHTYIHTNIRTELSMRHVTLTFDLQTYIRRYGESFFALFPRVHSFDRTALSVGRLFGLHTALSSINVDVASLHRIHSSTIFRS